MPPTRPRATDQAVDRLWFDMYEDEGRVETVRSSLTGVHERLDRVQATLVSGMLAILVALIGGVFVLLAHL